MQRWIHPEKDRYYLVDLVEDLLGDWTLVLCWGALGSRRGRLRIVGVGSEADGLAQMEDIARRRRQRGYRRQVDPESLGVGRVIPTGSSSAAAQRSSGDD